MFERRTSTSSRCAPAGASEVRDRMPAASTSADTRPSVVRDATSNEASRAASGSSAATSTDASSPGWSRFMSTGTLRSKAGTLAME